LFPYADVVISAPIFAFTGGFLSPFIITHVATNIGSVIVYKHNRNLAKHTFLLLLISFLGVAALQIAGVLPVYVCYASEMIKNRIFFAFIITIVTLIIIASYVLISALNSKVHLMLDEMSAAFLSIVKGTSPVAGTDFFNHLIMSCVETLRVDRVILGELVNKGKAINILAQAGVDGYGEQDINISGTLFSEIISSGELFIENGKDLPDVARRLVEGIDNWSFLGTALRDSAGKPIGIFCVISKGQFVNKYLVNAIISVFSSRAAAELERKIIDDRQKQTEQQLAQANKLNVIGMLAGGITHDLNNILTVIIGYANMLVARLDEASPVQMFASKIVTATSHAIEQTGMLSKFLRKEKIEMIPVNVNCLISDTVLFLESTVGKNIVISKRLTGQSLQVMGDRTKLQNVFMNLIINARDAIGKKNGTIMFTTGSVYLENECSLCHTFQIESGDYCTVEVSDNGSGMSQETMSHLFEPFFTTKPKGRGTGLGLANVRGYVECYKSAIEVKSEPGKGSTFKLYLPLIK